MDLSLMIDIVQMFLYKRIICQLVKILLARALEKEKEQQPWPTQRMLTMTGQQTKGAFFLLDSAAFMKKGKKKKRNKAVEKNKLLQWGYPVLLVQARNKAKGNHRLADPNSYTCVSRLDGSAFAGLHVRHWVLAEEQNRKPLSARQRRRWMDHEGAHGSSDAAAAALTVVYCWKGSSSYGMDAPSGQLATDADG